MNFLARIIAGMLVLCMPFQVIQAQSLTGFQPTSGPVGTLLTLSGSGLDALADVTVGGTAAVIVNKSATQAQVLVMPGSATGAVAAGSATAPGTFTVSQTPFPSNQQGAKLVGIDSDTNSTFGSSVAISADGNTVLIGGALDNNLTGAAWVFTRSGSTWAQQGLKLVGTGGGGEMAQGISVALSADGNTALVGGQYDDNSRGAAWVFVRAGNTWSQQGPKLVPTGSGGLFGESVALSADGSTAIIGGTKGNDGLTGAAWIFTRTDTTWAQQGSMLVGTGIEGPIQQQGVDVDISADGNTAIVGGWADNNELGAAWVFTRSGSVWSQQGPKLVGTGSVGTRVYQGHSVSLSADGNTALVCAHADNTAIGASWVFTRTGGTWSQQGPKLVGSGYAGPFPAQGFSAALTADGNTALISGPRDSDGGAAWVFTRSGSTWSEQPVRLTSTERGPGASAAGSIAVTPDGKTAILGAPGDNDSRGAAWVFVADVETGTEPPIAFGGNCRVGPNPTDGPLNVYLSLRQATPVRVEVVNALGQVLLSREVLVQTGSDAPLALDLGFVKQGTFLVVFSHAGTGELLCSERVVVY